MVAVKDINMNTLLSLEILLLGPFVLVVFAHNRHHWTILHDKSDHAVCDPDIPSRPSPVRPATHEHDDGEARIVCREGEYLDWYKCSPCDKGTFMTRQMVKSNRLSRCHKCQEPDMYEIVTEACTRTRDAKIMCEDGLYRYEVWGKPCLSACIRCDICGVGKNMFNEFEGSACGGYNNTVCCPGDNMIVVEGRCIFTERATTTMTLTTEPETEHSPETLSLHGEQPGWKYPEDVERVEHVYLDTKEFGGNFGHNLKMDNKLLLIVICIFFNIVVHV